MSEQTPRPWRRNGCYIETIAKPTLTIADVLGMPDQAAVDADFIVRCVNSHAALLAALEAVEWGQTEGYPPHAYWYACPSCKQRQEQGHAPDCQLTKALADAKGEVPVGTVHA